MQAYHINQDTVSKLYSQMASQHVIPGLTLESLTNKIHIGMGSLQFEFERVLSVALLLFQSQGDLDAVLTAAIYPSSSQTCTRDWNKVIKRHQFVLSTNHNDFYCVRYALDVYGKPVEQLVNDVALMYNLAFLPGISISNPILLGQYRALAVRWLVISVSHIIFRLSMASPTGTQGSSLYPCLYDIEDMIAQDTFSLEQIPIERREAFNELIYKPLLHAEKDVGAFEEWIKKTADYTLTHHTLGSTPPARDTFAMLVYYRYGPRPVSNDCDKDKLELELIAIPDCTLAIEI